MSDHEAELATADTPDPVNRGPKSSAKAEAMRSILASKQKQGETSRLKQQESTTDSAGTSRSIQAPATTSGTHTESPDEEDSSDSDDDGTQPRRKSSVIQMPTYVAYGKPKPFTAKNEEDFEIFLARMEDYFALSKIRKKDKLVSLLLNLDGSARKAADILKIRTLSYDAAVDALKNYFVPPETRNEWRMKFQNRCRLDQEAITTFAQELRILASKAYPKFEADAQEELTIQRFIAGLGRPMTAQRLFMKQPPSLKAAVEYAKLSEAAYQLTKRPSRSDGAAMSVTQPRAKPRNNNRKQHTYSVNANQPNAFVHSQFQPKSGAANAANWSTGKSAKQNPSPQKHSRNCWNCGKIGHYRYECRAPRRQPNDNGVSGSTNEIQPSQQHRSNADNNPRQFRNGSNRQRTSNINKRQQSEALAVLQEQDEISLSEDFGDLNTDGEDGSFMIQLTCATTAPANTQSETAYISAKVNEVQVNNVLIDTGSCVTLMSETMWNACREPEDLLQHLPQGGFVTANKSKLNVMGQTLIRIRLAGIDAKHPVIVVRDLAKHFILGSDFMPAQMRRFL